MARARFRLVRIYGTTTRVLAQLPPASGPTPVRRSGAVRRAARGQAPRQRAPDSRRDRPRGRVVHQGRAADQRPRQRAPAGFPRGARGAPGPASPASVRRDRRAHPRRVRRRAGRGVRVVRARAARHGVARPGARGADGGRPPRRGQSAARRHRAHRGRGSRDDPAHSGHRPILHARARDGGVPSRDQPDDRRGARLPARGGERRAHREQLRRESARPHAARRARAIHRHGVDHRVRGWRQGHRLRGDRIDGARTGARSPSVW